jgi:hypothetical protein
LIGLGLTAPQIKEEYIKFEMKLLDASVKTDKDTLDAYLRGVVKEHTGNSESMMFSESSAPNNCKL